MENWKEVLYAFWYYPAVIMTVFTVIALVVAWTLPLKRKVPFPALAHLIFFMHNPKDDFLYHRPSFQTGAFFLVAGLVPVVNLVLLGVHGLFFLLGVYHYGEKAYERIVRSSKRKQN